jgi:hypothetical protein|tara:strand:+ start:6941 stop:7159 length:219 start_codon:yes stop_codon:yes gene_type:complete
MAKLALIFSIALLMVSCTTVEQVRENKELYCSGIYKGMRAVGRGALSATTGVVVPDVCDTIDEIVSEENAEE